MNMEPLKLLKLDYIYWNNYAKLVLLTRSSYSGTSLFPVYLLFSFDDLLFSTSLSLPSPTPIPTPSPSPYANSYPPPPPTPILTPPSPLRQFLSPPSPTLYANSYPYPLPHPLRPSLSPSLLMAVPGGAPSRFRWNVLSLAHPSSLAPSASSKNHASPVLGRGREDRLALPTETFLVVKITSRARWHPQRGKSALRSESSGCSYSNAEGDSVDLCLPGEKAIEFVCSVVLSRFILYTAITACLDMWFMHACGYRYERLTVKSREEKDITELSILRNEFLSNQTKKKRKKENG